MKCSHKLYPKTLTIELTTRCNGKCIYCVRSSYIPKIIDFDIGTYKHIIDSLPDVKTVFPVSFGESLLYPEIVQAIAYAREKNKCVILVTNGSLLDNTMSNELLIAGLSQLRISVDASDRKTYNTLRPGLDFDILVENIKRFTRIQKKLGTSCRIVARITLTKENEKRIETIKSFWRNLGCSVTVKREIDIPIETDNRYSSKNKTACKWALRTLTIKANGNVALCCKDWFGWYISGNVYQDEILDVFNSERFREIRCNMANGENYPSICDICTSTHRRHK
jgi:MoaA/NifB/PqqE/SkfB family radical SAM enzyme